MEYVRDPELARALGVELSTLRKRVRALVKQGIVRNPQRLGTGVGNECVYLLDPDDCLAVLARLEVGEHHRAREFVEAARRAKLEEAARELAQELLFAKDAELGALRGKAAAAEEESARLARLLRERWTDNVLPPPDDPGVFPERVCPGRLLYGSVRAMWNDHRIYVRVAREPRHFQGRVAIDWVGADDRPTQELAALPEDYNHDFEGLQGIEVKARLPVVYFNSETHAGSIVVGFQVQSREWDPDDYRAHAEFIGRTAAGRMVVG